MGESKLVDQEGRILRMIRFLFYGQLLVVLITATYFSFLMIFRDFKPNESHYIFLLGLVGLLALTNVYFLWRDVRYYRMVENKSLMQSEAYTNIESLNRTLRMQRHDFLNHLQILYSLMEMNEFDEAQKYLDTLYEHVNSVNERIKTKSVAVNALLQAKANEAENRSIQYEVRIRTPFDKANMPDWEVCRVLGNLIDNAFEAASYTHDKRVEIELTETILGYELQIQNTSGVIPVEDVETLFNQGFSTKKDKEDHGMGLYICKSLLEKYHNSIHLQADDNQVKVRVQIQKVTVETGR